MASGPTSLSVRLHITESPVSTPVAWASAMSYERVEFVSILHEWLRLDVFRRDDIFIKESFRYFCSVGLPPTQEHVLCLTGKAARTREPLYLKLVRQLRHTMITDLDVDIRFGTHVGDLLPLGLRVTPLLETAHFRAARYWRRAFWAMRAGIVRKIAETRALAQQRINASSGPASSSAAKRQTALYRPSTTKKAGEAPGKKAVTSSKPLVPMSTYHAECSASSVELDRLALNAPTLVVVWASWDIPSLSWLEEFVFPVGGARDGEDAWVTLLKRYLFVSDKTTWSSVMEQRSTGRAPKQRSVSPPPPREDPRGGKVSPLSDSADGDGAAAASPSLCKRGNLVLVSVDSDVDAANSAIGDLQRRARFWSSADVSMSAVWAGPSGMQSDLAVNLDVHTLPLVAACDPPDRPGAPPSVKVLDQGELAREKRRRSTISRRRSTSTAEPGDASLSRIGLPMWHDVNVQERGRLLDIVANAVQSNDAPLVLESVVNIDYPAMNDGDHEQPVVYEKESDLLTYGAKSSLVTLRGSCCRTVLSGPETLDALHTISTRVRNSEVHVELFAPSAPLSFVFDALTPEHRVKGAYWNVTCMHCRSSVRTEKEPHYRCLHCAAKQNSMCVACYENRLHPAHHVCVKIRHDTTKVCLEPLWGSSNVGVLPTMHGKVLTSASGVHHDSICNGCKGLIQGARWKCCCCHEFELCSMCEGTWWSTIDGAGSYAAATAAAAKASTKPKFHGADSSHHVSSRELESVPPSSLLSHPDSHYMLHIRAPLIGEASGFLHPSCDRLEFAPTL